MQKIPKCLLLPIDGTEESLRPAGFLSRLYPPSEVRLILCYFSPPPPPIYSGEVAESNELLKRKWQFFKQLERDERRVFDHAREALAAEGFSKEFIQEYVEPKKTSVAKQACLLGDMRKVDAIIVQKHITSRIEALTGSGHPSSALVQQCIQCPIWLTDGEIDTKKAAIHIVDEEASLRIADHAGYMLSGTDVDIVLILTGSKISQPLSCRPSEALNWLAGHTDENQLSYLFRASAILEDYGIVEDRIQITLVPHRGHTITQILSWCASHGVGIIGLGRTPPEGLLGFSRTSAASKISSEFENMAIWVA